jgi:hypothetical protein
MRAITQEEKIEQLRSECEKNNCTIEHKIDNIFQITILQQEIIESLRVRLNRHYHVENGAVRED